MPEVEVYMTVKKSGVTKQHIVAITEKIMRKIGVGRGGVSVHLIGMQKMKTLNARYRGKDYPTDVLSFGLLDGETVKADAELGDLFLCVPVIRNQAKDWEVTYKEELYRMLVHGLLHLVGHDHITKKDAEKMFGLQEKYLRTIL